MRLFVYGTLKEGFPNFATNRGKRVPGEFRTVAPFLLYLVGPRCVPWMLTAAAGGQRITGQVFDVDAAMLADMDRLERVGLPGGYRRVEIPVERVDAPGALTVFAYLKDESELTADVERVGPLSVYTAEQASRYRIAG